MNFGSLRCRHTLRSRSRRRRSLPRLTGFAEACWNEARHWTIWTSNEALRMHIKNHQTHHISQKQCTLHPMVCYGTHGTRGTQFNAYTCTQCTECISHASIQLFEDACSDRTWNKHLRRNNARRRRTKSAFLSQSVCDCSHCIYGFCCFTSFSTFCRARLQVPGLVRAQVWQETTAQRLKSDEIELQHVENVEIEFLFAFEGLLAEQNL